MIGASPKCKVLCAPVSAEKVTLQITCGKYHVSLCTEIFPTLACQTRITAPARAHLSPGHITCCTLSHNLGIWICAARLASSSRALIEPSRRFYNHRLRLQDTMLTNPPNTYDLCVGVIISHLLTVFKRLFSHSVFNVKVLVGTFPLGS